MSAQDLEVKVINDFLTPEQYRDIVYSFLYSEDLPWHKEIIVPLKNDDAPHPCHALCEDKYNIQFVHTLYKDHEGHSPLWETVISTFAKGLNARAILRAKVNWTQCTEEIQEHGYHVDYDFEHYTAIYYLNTNDGYTKFKDGTKIDSIANRLLKIPSKVYHTGSTCTNGIFEEGTPNKGRFVLNINYL